MVAAIKEHLTQRLGHKADHRNKAQAYRGLDPKSGEPYSTPMLVMAKATVLYDLAHKAGVKDLLEANYAWRMVDLLGQMFPCTIPTWALCCATRS